jgi:deoxyuridine 5'-triphosphate nucleotidohydrolase
MIENIVNKTLSIELDEFQAYLLGYTINIAYIDKYVGKYHIDLKKCSTESKRFIIDIVDSTFNNSDWVFGPNSISIYNKQLCENYLKLFDDQSMNCGIRENVVIKMNQFPNFDLLNERDLFWTFISGYIRQNAKISNMNYLPKCFILFYNQNFMDEFIKNIKIPNNNSYSCNYSGYTKIMEFASTNCIDLLGLVYKKNTNNVKINNFNIIFKNKFEECINWKNLIIRNNSINNKLDICKIYKDCPEAIIPSKGKESDVGYDLTIIKEFKQLTPSTILYDTGIKLCVDFGYYIQIVPRSSLSKSGYILANSIGIIEKSYSGNLLVALTKIDKEMPDLRLPFKCCQLIFQQQISLNIVEIHNINQMDETTRGDGGFGSSDK